ncbi:MAG: flagellar biosynthetic protein FliQ [Myxococcota bacterium]|mgnify:CR=1 FL=1|nr:EscS/YscS/HrcS family type III secretion system export apparatus protein [Myxococcales bacterium]MEC7750733.1 flagellar biosynthetic protein FliQ [Myxococcota bacterium]
MSADMVINILANSIIASMEIAGPFLIIGLVVGLVMSLFQTLTQLQEPSLVFVPKVAAIIGLAALIGPWSLDIMVTYVTETFNLIGPVAGP